MLQVIDRIHEQFFANQRLREVDVREILAAEQRRVLTGCCILFSRIFPVGEMQPHMHPLWRIAEQFGANCCLTINDKVTHVVAISLGTDKVCLKSASVMMFLTCSFQPLQKVGNDRGPANFRLDLLLRQQHGWSLIFLWSLSLPLIQSVLTRQVNWATATGRPVVRPGW